MPAEGTRLSRHHDPPPHSVEGLFVMRAVIVANGRLSHPAIDRRRVAAGDWLLAADGGLRNCGVLGLTPAVVIGDLDSVDPSELAHLQAGSVTIVRHPERKDE